MPALLLALAALLGAPLFVLIGAVALMGFESSGVDLSVIAIEIYRLAEMPVLTAIPLFTFAGYLLSESGAPGRLLRLTQALVGWAPGGLAIVALVACALFTALTGATGVTIVALGALLFPALKQAGYPDRFNLGLVTTSGSLGLLLPPSLPLILYAVVAQQLNLSRPVSVEDLFLAGIFPGLLMVALLGLWGWHQNRHLQLPLTPFSWRNLGRAARESVWEIPLPFVVLGGVYTGRFAVSEAAAVTALYVLIIEVFVYRDLTLRQLPKVMRESMVVVGGILAILAMSLASTNFLVDADVPNRLFRAIQSYIESPLTFLIVLNIFLLVLGVMLDIFSATVLMVPLILPLAVGYGIDPVHLGIIFLANMQIGYLTPPVGMSLFIASYRFNRPMTEVVRATLPFMLLLLLAVLIITYWPALSLALLTRPAG